MKHSILISNNDDNVFFIFYFLSSKFGRNIYKTHRNIMIPPLDIKVQLNTYYL